MRGYTILEKFMKILKIMIDSGPIAVCYHIATTIAAVHRWGVDTVKKVGKFMHLLRFSTSISIYKYILCEKYGDIGQEP